MTLNELTDDIEAKLNNTGITNGEELDNLIKQIFPTDSYVGVIQYKSVKDLPKLKNNQFALLNKDTHWTIIFKKNDKLYEFDSYGRDMLGKGYRDVKFKNFKQPLTEMNCGQRSVAVAIKELLI